MNKEYLNINAHKMVSDLATEMAQTLYEQLAGRNDDFYKQYKDRNHYVRLHAPLLRDEAVKILSEMLTRNDVSDDEKERIYDALLKDKALPRNGLGVTHR